MGGLYGVMEKTGALGAVIDNWSKKFAGKETKFLVLTVVLFVLLSSVIGLVVPLFILGGCAFQKKKNRNPLFLATPPPKIKSRHPQRPLLKFSPLYVIIQFTVLLYGYF